MKILPAVLDWRPDYLAGAGDELSLLLAPAGTASVLCLLHERLPILATGALSVLPTFQYQPAYTDRIHRTCALVGSVTPAPSLGDSFRSCDLADWLLVADPCCFPTHRVDSEVVRQALAGARGGAIHLVAMASNPGGTVERVQLDAGQRVRGIQRYYDSRTWNFTSGVVCSLIQVSTLLAAGEAGFAAGGTLADLRCLLAARGVPTRDIPLACGVLHLRNEEALLRLSHNLAVARQREPSPRQHDARRGVRVDPSARLIGPVVLHDGVTIGRDALVIGPAVIGAGAAIAANATVVQCLVGPGVAVPPHVVLTRRAVFDPLPRTPVIDDLHYDEGAALVPLGLATHEPARRGSFYPVVKDVFDRLAALAALIVLAPLMLLIALLIKLESPGGVLYRDTRETQGGKPFRCWKFRTMCSDADGRQRELMMQNEVDGPQFKIEGDPRITRLGKWLRRVSLDELPQFVNVLRGEMSIVGPRPSPFRENQICIPWREARLSVRAGITGLWQVCRADRTAGDFHQWIHYDVLYVQHLSFMVDLKILVATVLTAGGLGRVSVERIVPTAAAQGAVAATRQPDGAACEILQ